MEKENLRPEDLMVGDLVLLWGDKPARVDCIGNVEVYLSVPMGKHELDWKVTYEHIKPIPLTPEILEKNGFHKTSLSWIIRDGFMGISFQFLKGKWSFSCRNEIQKKDEMGRADLISINHDWCSVIYVHELQHALRLCGIDKEIVL